MFAAAVLAVALMLALLGAVSPGEAGAADECDLVASPDGSDSDRGSVDDPLATVDELLDRLEPEQTGCLRAGTYVDRQFLVNTPGVTLTSYSGERATLRGQLRFNADADGAVASNMLLDGRNEDDLLGPLIYADRVVLRGNEITNHNTSICVHVDDYPGERPPRGVVIEDNRIHNCGELPANNHEHGIYIAKARGTVVRDNLIYDNADRGVQMYPDADGTLVSGNVIDGNGEGVIFGGGRDSSSDDNLVVGNVITNSRIRYNIENSWQGPTGNGNVARDNCVWTERDEYRGRPDGSGVAKMSGAKAIANTIADPGYSNSRSGDFTVSPRSKCLRTVLSAPVEPAPFDPPPGLSEGDPVENEPPSGDHSSGEDHGTQPQRGHRRKRSVKAPCSTTRRARSLVRHMVGTHRRDRLRGGRRGSTRISGRRGNDIIRTGRGGRNCVIAGAGRDRIHAVNGRRDIIRCGPGRDFARVDRKDRVRACERVHRVHRSRR